MALQDPWPEGELGLCFSSGVVPLHSSLGKATLDDWNILSYNPEVSLTIRSQFLILDIS